MRQFLNIIFGIKPVAGKYIIIGKTTEMYTKVIREEDITGNGVWLHWECFQSEFISYRWFHALYKKVD